MSENCVTTVGKKLFVLEFKTIIFNSFRSWQGPKVYPDEGWLSSCCLAPQELSQASPKALNIFVKRTNYIFISYCTIVFEILRLNKM